MAGQRPDHTLQATALVNEAYLRLADQSSPNFTSRSHFFAVAAQAMRQILVNYARASQSQKRSGGACKVELDDAALLLPEQDQAITLIERLLSTPGPIHWPDSPRNITLADVRLRWEWDSQRKHPRFQKILATPEPKTILPASH